MLTTTEISFGLDCRSKLEFVGQLVDRTSCGLPAVENLRATIFRALANPMEFPPLEQAIVAGDRVVLAVDPTVPQLSDVVASVVSYLIDRNVEAGQLSIVVAGHEATDVQAIERAIAQITAVPVPIEMHDADDSTKVAYLAANHDADPIYMNRTLVDAEVVIPITCARGRGSLDYLGSNTVFPRLSDRKTRGRFFSLARLERQSEHDRLQAWADEAAWWVGLCVAIEVVPGSHGDIGDVLAGSPAALEAVVQERMERAWETSVQQPAEAVLALVDGGRSQQTWDNVARAIHSARKAVARGGSIVVCCQVTEQPGRALRRLSDPNRSAGTLERQLSNDSSDDALAAAVILEALGENHVYLFSGIASETIEDLGMGAIENPAQLEHLLVQYSTLLILGSAQHRFLTGHVRSNGYVRKTASGVGNAHATS